ncbi:cold-shock protein [Streptomyces lancefieldiae]|uniref:Cold shock domain-containing protein n=1 Tax=Streptomyces lancefieldiae TaxID=3075520 RepID=A0ABU3AY36_9ACTN|nr:cold shock domain-containing protein [Streptomyces sp. DSM 40712]MDT0615097.1 cold shock domain-containing protein [Streptomyces sp. DSM 40712]
MVAGRVIRFDGTRGYGFIAPESGGEDVFLHVNDLLIPEAEVRPGLQVEFEVEDGGRGLKASSVRHSTQSGAERSVPSVPTPAAAASSAGGAPAFSGAKWAEPDKTAGGDEPMCDVLSVEQFTSEVTELLLKAGPGLTAAQVLEIRHELLKFGERHGWSEA